MLAANSYDHDIALIKLVPRGDQHANDGFIVYSDYVQPACLPAASTNYSHAGQCLVSGWGSTGYSHFQGAHCKSPSPTFPHPPRHACVVTFPQKFCIFSKFNIKCRTTCTE